MAADKPAAVQDVFSLPRIQRDRFGGGNSSSSSSSRWPVRRGRAEIISCRWADILEVIPLRMKWVHKLEGSAGNVWSILNAHAVLGGSGRGNSNCSLFFDESGG